MSQYTSALDKVLERWNLCLKFIDDVEKALDSTDLSDKQRIDHIILKLEEYNKANLDT